jgi:hypothetical protein
MALLDLFPVIYLDFKYLFAVLSFAFNKNALTVSRLA